MKKLQSLFLILALGTFIATTSSCKKDDPTPTPAKKTIAQLATETPSLSLLLAAVKRAGLVEAVSAPGTLTVFAPNNDAFKAAGFIDENSINTADQALVTAVVKGHVLSSVVLSKDLKEGQEVPTLQTGVSLVVSLVPSASVKIKGSTSPASKVISADILASNGVVHVIDKVLLP